MDTTLLNEKENAQSSIPSPAAKIKILFPLNSFPLNSANNSELHCSRLLLVTNPPFLIKLGDFSKAEFLNEACNAAKLAFSLSIFECL